MDLHELISLPDDILSLILSYVRLSEETALMLMHMRSPLCEASMRSLSISIRYLIQQEALIQRRCPMMDFMRGDEVFLRVRGSAEGSIASISLIMEFIDQLMRRCVPRECIKLYMDDGDTIAIDEMDISLDENTLSSGIHPLERRGPRHIFSIHENSPDGGLSLLLGMMNYRAETATIVIYFSCSGAILLPATCQPTARTHCIQRLEIEQEGAGDLALALTVHVPVGIRAVRTKVSKQSNIHLIFDTDIEWNRTFERYSLKRGKKLSINGSKTIYLRHDAI